MPAHSFGKNEYPYLLLLVRELEPDRVEGDVEALHLTLLAASHYQGLRGNREKKRESGVDRCREKK